MNRDISVHLVLINAPISVMPEGEGPRDRVGTLIRNENLESNFLTLGIRFQFKVPHLGEGSEFTKATIPKISSHLIIESLVKFLSNSLLHMA